MGVGLSVTCEIVCDGAEGEIAPTGPDDLFPAQTTAAKPSARTTNSAMNENLRTDVSERTSGAGEAEGAYRRTAPLDTTEREMPDIDRTHHVSEQRREAHPPPVSRRSFLQRSAMAVAGGVLFSCTGGRPIPSVVDPTPAIDTRWPIKRAIYLMLENRSFDNIFGRFPGVNGATTGVNHGKEQALIPCPDWLPGDLPHDRAAALDCLNGGKLDGFSGGKWGAVYGYSQFDEPQIPNYYQWAREYAISDNFFASALGPSYPNHYYFIAGQSGGTIDNPENIQSDVKRDKDGNVLAVYKSWGCDAMGDDVFVFVKDQQGNLSKHDSCFTFGTVGEQLSAANLDWAYYSAVWGQSGYFWNAYNGIHDVFHDEAYWHAHMRPVDRLIGDIEADRLPSVTWITPRFELSDHPPYSTSFSHNWVTDIVNAVMQSDSWEHTAIFLTWDEWGGFYDHVMPHAVDDVGMGFRVPLLTISPYTRRGLIDDELGEFSTPLRFIADNWGLKPLTPRIAKTHNMEHVFDFSKPPRPPQPTSVRAKTYGQPFGYVPEGYPGWPPGTQPSDYLQ
jgi:phospholipase C